MRSGTANRPRTRRRPRPRKACYHPEFGMTKECVFADAVVSSPAQRPTFEDEDDDEYEDDCRGKNNGIRKAKPRCAAIT